MRAGVYKAAAVTHALSVKVVRRYFGHMHRAERFILPFDAAAQAAVEGLGVIGDAVGALIDHHAFFFEAGAIDGPLHIVRADAFRSAVLADAIPEEMRRLKGIDKSLLF